MGCFMYVIFGTSKDIALGPAAIVAFLTAEHASKDPAFVVLLTFLTGLIIMLLGFLRLGKYLKYRTHSLFMNLNDNGRSHF